MKKLLSLLSVLTISGSTIPTTIAASPYQKQEEINKIDSLQENNLEKLNRNKRQSNRNQNNCNQFVRWEQSLEINSYDSQARTYESGISGIISFLLDNQIIERVFSNSNGYAESPYSINRNLNNNTNYFVIPVSIDNDRNIELIFRSRDLYLQGFVNNNHYYHFSRDPGNTNNDDLLIYPNVDRNNNHDLGFIGHYNVLMGTNDQSITWNNIHSAFFELTNIGTRHQQINSIIQAALGRVILATSEAIRFRSIFNLISNNLIQNQGSIYWNNYAEDQISVYNIVTNWDTNSRNFDNLENLINPEPQRNIAIISLGAAIYYWNTCQRRYGKRDINNLQNFCGKLIFKNLNNNQFCYIENKKSYYISNTAGNYDAREINEITGSVNDIAIYSHNTGPTIANSLYFATNNGLYFMGHNSWTPHKINGIDEKVNHVIIAQSSGAAYAIGDLQEFINQKNNNSHDEL